MIDEIPCPECKAWMKIQERQYVCPRSWCGTTRPLTWTPRQRKQYTTCGDLIAVRAIWAEVTKTPNATIDELTKRTGLKRSKTYRCLNTLLAAEYIERDRYVARGRRVVVPFFTAQVHEAQPPYWERARAA